MKTVLIPFISDDFIITILRFFWKDSAYYRWITKLDGDFADVQYYLQFTIINHPKKNGIYTLVALIFLVFMGHVYLVQY